MEKTNIFFDLDGTLTDSMPGITRAVQYALKRYGIVEDDLEKLRPFVGPPLPESFKAYYQFSQEDADAAVYVFREYYNEIGWAQNSVYDGVEDMLSGLKAAGKKLYVATSKPEDMAKRVLGHFGLTEYFTFIGGANDDSSRVEKDDVIRYVTSQAPTRRGLRLSASFTATEAKKSFPTPGRSGLSGRPQSFFHF